MELKGKIVQLLPLKQGKSAKGEWQKQDFIVETQEQFPKKVCISVWNNKFDVQSYEGKEVNVFINLESREYNGKWYTDVRAWKIESQEKAGGQEQPPIEAYNNDIEGMSFSNDDNGADDLPF